MTAIARKTVLACSLLLSVSACTSHGGPIDYESKVSLVQTINVGDAKTVSFVSGCNSFSVDRLRDTNAVKLEITGGYSIRGFYGTSETIHPLEPVAFEFKVSRVGETLVMDSPEWRFVHHAQTIDALRITLPTKMEVTLKCLTLEQLEERGKAIEIPGLSGLTIGSRATAKVLRAFVPSPWSAAPEPKR